MTIDYKVPFYSNTSDNTHCYQAALRMVLKFFCPNKEYTWDELDKITAKVEGMWTWPMAGLLWLQEQGFQVQDYENFNYEEFIKRGGNFLRDEYGEEVGTAQINHSIIDQEKDFAVELLKKISIKKGKFTVKDIKKLLQDKYLIICLVNSQKLNNQEGYVGHFVVIKGITNNELILHDPGLPPQENRKVSFEEFEKAWAYPNEKAKNIMAFRLKK